MAPRTAEIEPDMGGPVADIDDRLSPEGSPDEISRVQRYSVSSYGADYPVSTLVDRMRSGAIYVPPFQRQYVWNQREASRFVESLLLGLPVPGIFLSKERDTGKLLVIDGQQRLTSLLHFYDGRLPNGRPFPLVSVQKTFLDKTYETLEAPDRRALDDSILHATVFKQDEPTQGDGSIYEVFERLNTGGKRLTPQEVRSAIHHDSTIGNLLSELNKVPEWRQIYGRKDDLHMRDMELILRFAALLQRRQNYYEPMKEFLNEFMGEAFDPARIAHLRNAFENAICLVHAAIGRRAFRLDRALNAAVFDAVMVGTADRLGRGPITDYSAYRSAYEALLAGANFRAACERGTADTKLVQQRLGLAAAAFENVA